MRLLVASIACGTKSCEARAYRHRTTFFTSCEFNGLNRQCPRILSEGRRISHDKGILSLFLPYHHESRLHWQNCLPTILPSWLSSLRQGQWEAPLPQVATNWQKWSLDWAGMRMWNVTPFTLIYIFI